MLRRHQGVPAYHQNRQFLPAGKEFAPVPGQIFQAGVFVISGYVNKMFLQTMLPALRFRIVPVKYDNVGNFYEGRACVRIVGKWGFIDRDGNIVVPLKYDYVGNFRDGNDGEKLCGSDTISRTSETGL